MFSDSMEQRRVDHAFLHFAAVFDGAGDDFC